MVALGPLESFCKHKKTIIRAICIRDAVNRSAGTEGTSFHGKKIASHLNFHTEVSEHIESIGTRGHYRQSASGSSGACARRPERSAAAMAPPLAPTLLLFLLFGVGNTEATMCSREQASNASIDLLLAEYERQSAPERSEIRLMLGVRHATIREGAATLRLLADLTMKWQDERLSWYASDWDCDETLVDGERIWLPDVVPLTSGATSGAAGEPQKARLTSAGVVEWSMRLDLTTPCALDLARWPRDTQSCTVKFGSRILTADYLNITLGDSSNLNLVKWEAAAWELLTAQASAEIQEREYGRYSVASWTIKLMRRAPAHRLVCRVVVAAVVLQILAAAVLSPASRPPLCACAALTATIWMTTALLRLPAATTIPEPLSLMAGMLIVTCIAALAAALVPRVAGLRSAPPHCARRLVTSTQAYISTPEQVPEGAVSTWICLAELLDLVLLTSFVVVLGALVITYI